MLLSSPLEWAAWVYHRPGLPGQDVSNQERLSWPGTAHELQRPRVGLLWTHETHPGKREKQLELIFEWIIAWYLNPLPLCSDPSARSRSEKAGQTAVRRSCDDDASLPPELHHALRHERPAWWKNAKGDPWSFEFAAISVKCLFLLIRLMFTICWLCFVFYISMRTWFQLQWRLSEPCVAGWPGPNTSTTWNTSFTSCRLARSSRNWPSGGAHSHFGKVYPQHIHK